MKHWSKPQKNCVKFDFHLQISKLLPKCFSQGKMKKLFSILFLLLFLFTSGGYFVAFELEQTQIKSEVETFMKSGMADEKLELIKIPLSMEKQSNKLFQRINAKEFKYKGKMYDISKRVVKGDIAYYYCYYDHKEETLFANLNDFIAKHISSESDKSQNNQNDKHFLKNIIKEYAVPNTTLHFHKGYITQLLYPLEYSYSSLQQQVLVPPPKLS